MNNITLIGRLVSDPELKYLPNSGIAVANYTLAVDRGLSKEKKQEAESKGQQTVDFINIVTFNKPAETVANYMRKGCLMAVEGRLQIRNWKDQEGKTRYNSEVITNNFQFLSFPQENQQSNKYSPKGFSSIDSDVIPF